MLVFSVVVVFVCITHCLCHISLFKESRSDEASKLLTHIENIALMAASVSNSKNISDVTTSNVGMHSIQYSLEPFTHYSL